MLSDIAEIYQRLMQKQQQLLQRIETCSPDKLSYKAGPDK